MNESPVTIIYPRSCMFNSSNRRDIKSPSKNNRPITIGGSRGGVGDQHQPSVRSAQHAHCGITDRYLHHQHHHHRHRPRHRHRHHHHHHQHRHRQQHRHRHSHRRRRRRHHHHHHQHRHHLRNHYHNRGLVTVIFIMTTSGFIDFIVDPSFQVMSDAVDKILLQLTNGEEVPTSVDKEESNSKQSFLWSVWWCF